MKPLAPRLDRLSRRRLHHPPPELTPEMKRAWCLKLGIDPNSILLGRPETGFVILPPEVSE